MSFTWFADKPMLSRADWLNLFIRVADDLDMPDFEGAVICALMCAFQEAGADPHRTGQRQIWVPGNLNDPCFAADRGRYPHDSIGNDGRSVGPFQQQTSGPPPAVQWGWGGLYGDPQGTRRRMSPRLSTELFMAALKQSGYSAANARAANDSIQRVQRSGFPLAYEQWWNEARNLYNGRDKGVTDEHKPDFNEFPIWSSNCSPRSVKVDCFFLHTQEGGGGDSAAENLAKWFQNANGVSYHYALSQASDGGVTVVDCVDTDLASWSVLSANGRSINLCFAGSRSAWTRNDWLVKAGKAIDVAAYLAVQDARKYGFSIQVIRPPYTARIPGISDHRYVTKVLGDGTHTDLGDGFPWDIFAERVLYWASPATPPTPELPGTKQFPGDWTDRDIAVESLRQQRGVDLDGWPQLGGRTQVDYLAHLGQKVDSLAAMVTALVDVLTDNTDAAGQTDEAPGGTG